MGQQRYTAYSPRNVEGVAGRRRQPSNALSPDGYTILHFADDFEAFEVIKVLSDAGADAMARDQPAINMTGLCCASCPSAGHPKRQVDTVIARSAAVVVVALLDAGAKVDVWSTPRRSATPFCWTTRTNDPTAKTGHSIRPPTQGGSPGRSWWRRRWRS